MSSPSFDLGRIQKKSVHFVPFPETYPPPSPAMGRNKAPRADKKSTRPATKTPQSVKYPTHRPHVNEPNHKPHAPKLTHNVHTRGHGHPKTRSEYNITIRLHVRCLRKRQASANPPTRRSFRLFFLAPQFSGSGVAALPIPPQRPPLSVASQTMVTPPAGAVVIMKRRR